MDMLGMLIKISCMYEPIYAKWTSERCAVCRWIEDWDDNKIIICNRCQIVVHQECYGCALIRVEGIKLIESGLS
ncbi:Histone-lysine N-methyltransferase ATX [Salix suchowensis]|nr:Histone-lysine N-methyltransferase ATX [Salix suchowensis]